MIWLLVAAGAAGVAQYVGSCWWRPFKHCARCDGAGKFPRRDGKVWRNCPRCKGAGKALRVGRRVWNAARQRRAAARKV